MVRPAGALSLVAVAWLAGCTLPPRVVDRPVLARVAGPVEHMPVPEGLLGCVGDEEPERPAALADGISGGELVARAQGWEAYALCLEAKLAQVRALNAAGPSGHQPGPPPASPGASAGPSPVP